MLVSIQYKYFWAVVWPIICKIRKNPLRIGMNFHVDVLNTMRFVMLRKLQGQSLGDRPFCGEDLRCFP